MAIATYPKPIANIEKNLHSRFPKATVDVDPPANSDGVWFLNISSDGHAVAVQWQAGRGFGLTTNPSPDAYGEGAHEVFEDDDGAYKRIVSLLLGRSDTSPPIAVRLRELRSIRGISQIELAKMLKVQQAAVSKIETRTDNILLSTLEAVVSAMGGELRVVARFPDGVERQLRFADDSVSTVVHQPIPAHSQARKSNAH
jgi:DNA-binding Xre family transcriptional regulator